VQEFLSSLKVQKAEAEEKGEPLPPEFPDWWRAAGGDPRELQAPPTS
jgi:hypothetical protein